MPKSEPEIKSIINRTKSFLLFDLRCIRLSAMLNLETNSHFPSSKFACVHSTSVLSQRLVPAAVQERRLVAVMCRSDLSHSVFRPQEMTATEFFFFSVITSHQSLFCLRSNSFIITWNLNLVNSNTSIWLWKWFLCLLALAVSFYSCVLHPKLLVLMWKGWLLWPACL